MEDEAQPSGSDSQHTCYGLLFFSSARWQAGKLPVRPYACCTLAGVQAAPDDWPLCTQRCAGLQRRSPAEVTASPAPDSLPGELQQPLLALLCSCLA